MVLNFTKSENLDAQVCILNGTTQQPFSYTDLIKSLLNNEVVTCEFSENYSLSEMEQIKELINKIIEISKN